MSENWLRYYLGPTGIPDKLNALAKLVPMFADGQDFVDYYQAGGRTMNALGDRNLWGTVEGIGDMASAGAAMMLPGVTARAINEGVDVAGDLGRFVADEAGALRLGDDIEARGAQIMDMLRSGRGSEVTDQMLDLGDPVQNARLNEYLFNNYDLPMDTASRMDRAQGMGFDTATPLYHGTAADFVGFDEGARGGSTWADSAKAATWVTDSPNTAELYANSAFQQQDSALRQEVGRLQAQAYRLQRAGDVEQAAIVRQQADAKRALLTEEAILPLNVRGRFLDEDLGGASYEDGDVNISQYLSEARAGAQDGVILRDFADDPSGPNIPATHMGVFNPANIRSRFARFDPRLSHLRNLSAAGAGVAMLPREEDRNSDAAQIRAYLQSIGLE